MTSSVVFDTCAKRIVSLGSVAGTWAVPYLANHRLRLLKDLEILEEYALPVKSRVVEVGSSPPFLTVAMKSLGYDVVGLDLKPERFAEVCLSEDLEIRKIDIEFDRFPFESNSVDVVMMNEVFEHLRFPVSTVSEVNRILKPGGILLLSTPNLRSFRGILNLVLRGKGWAVGADPAKEHREPETIGHMGRVREYTAVEVGGFLKSFGLKPIRVIHRGHLGPLPERLLYRAVPWARPFMTVVACRE